MLGSVFVLFIFIITLEISPHSPFVPTSIHNSPFIKKTNAAELSMNDDTNTILIDTGAYNFTLNIRTEFANVK